MELKKSKNQNARKFVFFFEKLDTLQGQLIFKLIFYFLYILRGI
jgi:hypothetical protein